MEDRATAPRAGVGQSASHCAAASGPREGTDRHLHGTARSLELVYDSHHPRAQQVAPDSMSVLGTRVGSYHACCSVDCPPASAHRGGAGPLSSLRVSRVGPACLGGQCVVRPCGSSRCEDTVARPLVDGDDTQGVGPADMKPSLGDIGPGARRSRYRCERQPKRAIVHTGIPQRPPRGARPARAPWQPNLATEDSVRRSKMPKLRSGALGVHPRPCTQPDGPPKRPRRPRRAQRARTALQSADCLPL